MSNEKGFSKSTKIISVIIIICLFSSIGLQIAAIFTSRVDDANFIKMVEDDIEFLSRSNELGHHKIVEHVQNGFFFIGKHEMIELRKPQVRAINSFNREIMNSPDEYQKAKITYKFPKFDKEINLMKTCSLISNMGDAFTHRLLPVAQKIMSTLINFLDDDCFIVIYIKNNAIKMFNFDQNELKESRFFYIPRDKGYPSSKSIMMHIILRYVQ